MSLFIDLLCVTCGGANGTSRSHLAVFSEYVAFVCHFVTPCPPPTLLPYGTASGIGYASKNYLKWRAIQLAIQCTADAVNDLKQL